VSEEIKAVKGNYRKFFVDVNKKDGKVRKQFLDNPIATLKGSPYNFQLSADAELEIIALVNALKAQFPTQIYDAPHGYSVPLTKMGANAQDVNQSTVLGLLIQ
jgi:hypothetical protein